MYEAFAQRVNILVFRISLRQNDKAVKVWFLNTSSSFSVLSASPRGAVLNIAPQDLDVLMLIRVLF